MTIWALSLITLPLDCQKNVHPILFWVWSTSIWQGSNQDLSIPSYPLSHLSSPVSVVGPINCNAGAINEVANVVNFDQCLGAAHSIAFSTLFVLKCWKKEKSKKIDAKLSKITVFLNLHQNAGLVIFFLSFSICDGEIDTKNCKNAKTNDFHQRTACGAPVSRLKYTTNIQQVQTIVMCGTHFSINKHCVWYDTGFW